MGCPASERLSVCLLRKASTYAVVPAIGNCLFLGPNRAECGPFLVANFTLPGTFRDRSFRRLGAWLVGSKAERLGVSCPPHNRTIFLI